MTTGLFYEHDTTSLRDDLEAATAHLDASTRTRLAMILDRIDEQARDASEAEDRAYAAEEKVEGLESDLKQAEALRAKAEAAVDHARNCWIDFYAGWKQLHGALLPKELREAADDLGEAVGDFRTVFAEAGSYETDTGKLTAEVERLRQDAFDTVTEYFQKPPSAIDIKQLPGPAQGEAREIAARHRRRKWDGLNYILFDPTTQQVQGFALSDLIDRDLSKRLFDGSLRIVRGYKC
jgi:hypothetical protein